MEVDAVRQQAIIWADVDQDLSDHMVSPGQNELRLEKKWLNNVQTAFSNAFCLKKINVFSYTFEVWSHSRIYLTVGSGNGLVPKKTLTRHFLYQWLITQFRCSALTCTKYMYISQKLACCEIALNCTPKKLSIWIEKWIFVQVMAWCHQATSHFLSHCRPDPNLCCHTSI